MNLHLESLSNDELLDVASDALGNLAGRFDTGDGLDAPPPFTTEAQNLDPDRRDIFAALDRAMHHFDEARDLIKGLANR